MAKLFHVSFLMLLLAPVWLHAQERCGTITYNKGLHQERQVIETKQAFEDWLQIKMANRKSTLGSGREKASAYKVPIVIHVIHKGEPLGTGTNISVAQIASQINVLNKDFQRLNADAGQTPGEFTSVAGSMDIQFLLANVNPEGAATNGIVRMKGTKNQWAISDNYELKSLSYWPAEEYLNIWVTDLTGAYLGYAQLPVSGLPGLENSSNNRLTDGVVIDYKVFGSADDGSFTLEPQYNKGRTTTHEVGHFFGLRHIWGDDESDGNTCNGSDYVDDTPNQSISTSGCPAHPRATCTTNDMFQNFMDYTNDVCMNIITKGQVARMTTVIENSPRRATLLTSPALLDPVPLANDGGLPAIITPEPIVCNASISPTVTIKNYGNNDITSVKVELTIDGNQIQTKTFSVNLAPDADINLMFSTVSLTPSSHDVTFTILSTNAGTDNNSGNNSVTVNALVPNAIPIPFTETFNSFPSSWSISNPDKRITWTLTTAPQEASNNTAMYMDFYNYKDADGESDALYTPRFDLTKTPAAYLSFDVAYAPYPGNSDGLRVYVLTDCSNSIFDGTKMYDKFGSILATTSSTVDPFIPANGTEWRHEIIPLNDFTGSEVVQVAFVGLNNWGNRLYLDNVRVVTDVDENLTLTSVLSPRLLNCENQVKPSLLIENSGTVAVNSFTVSLQLNSAPATTITLNTVLNPGEQQIITLPEMTLIDGVNTVNVEVKDPNGLVDGFPNDNRKNIDVVYNPAKKKIPLRQDFDTTFDDWSIVNPTRGDTWVPVVTNYNQSLLFNAFDNVKSGDASWLISPSLDFQNITTASVFFDVSYAARNQADSLIVMATRDCGITYEQLATFTSESLSDQQSTAPWIPTTPDDWTRKFVVLNSVAGEKDARLIFKTINDNGNNIYLDNIELFASDNPNPQVVPPPFLLYGTGPESPSAFAITFNLPEQTTVGYEIVDTMGRTLVQEEIGTVLNQTFIIDAGHVATGVYIVRLRIGNTPYATKVFINSW